jgi:hypothetical protein
MLRAHARAFALWGDSGNRRRNSIAARQLSFLIEDGADRVGVGIGDDVAGWREAQ